MIDTSSQYDVHFLNQYAKIPNKILKNLNSSYPNEYESVRHCIGLIIVNLLEFGEVAYSRNKNFYSEKHTKHYTYANMMSALEITVADGYAVKSQTGYHGSGYERGRSSTLIAGPRLSEFHQTEDMELDIASLPLLTVDKKPVFEGDNLELIKSRSNNLSIESYNLINRIDRIYEEALKLNRDYWNDIIIDTSKIDSDQKCFSRVSLTRVFKDGGVGRWFQKGEMSYQQLSEEDRAKLLLNDEQVIEIDYSAMHLTYPQ